MDLERIRAALAGYTRHEIPREELPEHRPAAVLVPLVARETVNLVFTLRPESMRSHSGQISFPGGKADPADADLAATALREAWEELAIPQERVTVLGLLDDVPTPSGFIVTPVVGIVASDVEPRPNPNEVAEVFEVPVMRFRDPSLYEDMGMVERWGRRYQLSRYTPDGRNIWGATARMVYQLLRLSHPL